MHARHNPSPLGEGLYFYLFKGLLFFPYSSQPGRIK